MKGGTLPRLLIPLLLSFLAVNGIALAHVELEKASPTPGEILKRPPDRIHLTFSGELGPGTTIELFGDEFKSIEGVTMVRDVTRPREMQANLPTLPPGDYTVQWRAAGMDGDALSGSYAFRVVSTTSPLRLWPLVLLPAVLVVATLAWRRRR